MAWLAIDLDDKPERIIDRPCSVECPHCGDRVTATAIATPRYWQLSRHQPTKVIVGYCCPACKGPIALRFDVLPEYGKYQVSLSDEFEEVERPVDAFDCQYLPPEVASDFREALTCHAHGCYNAVAAMCRRTVQSITMALGAQGSAKVMAQLLRVQELGAIEEDTFLGLQQIIIDGHDGAHPHLPTITAARARMLIAMLKDVLHEIYIRKANIQHAAELRTEAIAERKKDGQ